MNNNYIYYNTRNDGFSSSFLNTRNNIIYDRLLESNVQRLVNDDFNKNYLIDRTYKQDHSS